MPDFKLEKVCRFCRKNRQGIAAVEFNLVAPVFVLLV
jgi:Flp pilus assembly protein TadG